MTALELCRFNVGSCEVKVCGNEGTLTLTEMVPFTEMISKIIKENWNKDCFEHSPTYSKALVNFCDNVIELTCDMKEGENAKLETIGNKRFLIREKGDTDGHIGIPNYVYIKLLIL